MTDELASLDTADEEERRSAAALARALDGGTAEAGLPEDGLQAAALLRLSAGGGRLRPERKGSIRRDLLAAMAPAPARTVRQSPPRWLLLGLPLAGAAAAVSLLLVRAPEHELGARGAPSPSVGARRPPTGTGDPGIESPARGSPALRTPDTSTPETSHPAASHLADEGFAALEQRRPAERELGAAASRQRAEAAPPELAAAARAQGPATRLRGGEARRAIVGLDRDVLTLRGQLLQRVAVPALTRVHAERDAAAGRAALERSREALVNALATLGGGLPEADARLLRQDLYCRLAETALELGEAQTALEWTRRGLDLDGPPTPFLAQLSALRGDAFAQLGDDERAAQSYLEALRVHETLLSESLDGR